jgi:hypothetical protein
MNRIGMALAAPLFAASIAVMTTAHANDANDKGASKNTQAQLDQSSPAASTTTSTDTSSKDDDNATRRNAREHPPTARMDAATPKTKPSSSESTAGHGPTSVMNRATPQEKGSQTDTKTGEASAKPQ